MNRALSNQEASKARAYEERAIRRIVSNLPPHVKLTWINQTSEQFKKWDAVLTNTITGKSCTLDVEVIYNATFNAHDHRWMSGSWDGVNVVMRKNQEKHADIYFRVNKDISAYAAISHDFINAHGYERPLRTTQAWRTDGEPETFLTVPYSVLPSQGFNLESKGKFYICDRWNFIGKTFERFLT